MKFLTSINHTALALYGFPWFIRINFSGEILPSRQVFESEKRIPVTGTASAWIVLHHLFINEQIKIPLFMRREYIKSDQRERFKINNNKNAEFFKTFNYFYTIVYHIISIYYCITTIVLS